MVLSVQVRERGLERLLLVGLLQELKRVPLQRQERVLLRVLGQRLERGLLRDEGRVLFKVQEQNLQQALVRRPVRGPVMGPERGQERPLYPVPLRLLLQVPEQGSFKGQARVQASPLRGCHFQRVRSNELRIQNLQRQERESA